MKPGGAKRGENEEARLLLLLLLLMLLVKAGGREEVGAGRAPAPDVAPSSPPSPLLPLFGTLGEEAAWWVEGEGGKAMAKNALVSSPQPCAARKVWGRMDTVRAERHTFKFSPESMPSPFLLVERRVRESEGVGPVGLTASSGVVRVEGVEGGAVVARVAALIDRKVDLGRMKVVGWCARGKAMVGKMQCLARIVLTSSSKPGVEEVDIDRLSTPTNTTVEGTGTNG